MVVDRILMIQKIAVTSGTLLSNCCERGFTVAGTSYLLEGIAGRSKAMPDHGDVNLDAA
jgi:hypothetical protein